MSRFAHFEVGRTDMLMEYASAALTQHLDDIQLEVAIGAATELPLQPSFMPVKAITDHELRCIARSIYLLVLGQGSRDYLDALIELVLGGEGHAIARIAAWVSSLTQVYTFLPSELTLPLAQGLVQKLKHASNYH